MRDDLSLLLGGENVHLFAGTPAQGQIRPPDGGVQDVQALRSFAESPVAVVVTPPRGMSIPLPPPFAVAARVIRLTKGERADFSSIIGSLNAYGFEQKDFVETHGDYSVRGGILDVFTFAGDNPIRAEFSGDEIESLREFDPISQRSIRDLCGNHDRPRSSRRARGRHGRRPDHVDPGVPPRRRDRDP